MKRGLARFPRLVVGVRLRPSQWPEVYKVVQSVIDHSPAPQRGNLAPVSIFTGQKADSPLLSIVVSHNATPLSLADIKQKKLVNIEQLQSVVDSIHKKHMKSSTSDSLNPASHGH
jgi:hypothetical protein